MIGLSTELEPQHNPGVRALLAGTVNMRAHSGAAQAENVAVAENALRIGVEARLGGSGGGAVVRRHLVRRLEVGFQRNDFGKGRRHDDDRARNHQGCKNRPSQCHHDAAPDDSGTFREIHALYLEDQGTCS